MACLWAGAAVADQFLPYLQTKTGIYSNVTVTLKNPGDIYILHDRGVGNIELSELDDATREALGYVVESRESEGAALLNRLPGEWLSALQRLREGEGLDGSAPVFEIPWVLSPEHIAIVAFVVLAVHLFFSYCGRLICVKSGNVPGLMIWLPILQVFPLLRAAGMSGWWFLGLLVPVVNVIVHILWCIKIVKARGKHGLWAILLLLPLLNVIAFMYLAFSNGTTARESFGFAQFSPRPV